QVVEDIRPDVVALDVELLKLPSYVDQVRRQHPDVTIPWAAYDDGEKASLGDLVAANLPNRPVLVVGPLKEDISARFPTIPSGLSKRFVAAGTAPVAAQAALDDLPRLAKLHPPTAPWPDTSWEGVMAANYGSAAFENARARQTQAPQADWIQIAGAYRQA